MLAAAVQELGEAATAGAVVTARARIAQTADSRPILSATPCRLVFFDMAMTSILRRAWRSNRRTQRRKFRSVGSEPVLIPFYRPGSHQWIPVAQDEGEGTLCVEKPCCLRHLLTQLVGT